MAMYGFGTRMNTVPFLLVSDAPKLFLPREVFVDENDESLRGSYLVCTSSCEFEVLRRRRRCDNREATSP